MSSFRPGVRKQQVKGFDRVARQQVTHRIPTFEVKDADITKPCRFPRRAARTASQAFDTEKIRLRHLLGQGVEERAVAASKVDL